MSEVRRNVVEAVNGVSREEMTTWRNIMACRLSMAEMMWHKGISRTMRSSESYMNRWNSTRMWAVLVAESFMIAESKDDEH